MLQLRRVISIGPGRTDSTPGETTMPQVTFVPASPSGSPRIYEAGLKIGGWDRKDRDAGGINRAIRQIQSMIEEMPYITEHLSSLRQEIADLRNLNARFTEKGDHTALDQTALELRTNRLREIKQELSQMLNRPDDPKVWWERARRGHLQA